MKKTVNIINTIFFHFHLAYLIIMLLVGRGLYILPHQKIFPYVYMWVVISSATFVQLCVNSVFWFVAKADGVTDIKLKAHNIAALSVWLAASILLMF